MATLDAEIFKCERYRPLVGWSADYLLPTDRNAFRIRGYKKSFRTIAEAEVAVLAPGWAWEELRDGDGRALGWEVDPTGQQVDAEGWCYSGNFTNNFEGSSKAGLQKFVRWKRLVRTQTFAGGVDALVEAARAASGRGAEAAPEAHACPYVDLEGAGRIGRILVEAVAMASLYVEWSEPALVQLKAQLLEKVAGKESGARETFEAMVQGFIGAQRGLATRVSEAFKAVDDAPLIARIAEVEPHFPPAEREAYAVLAIRRFRPDLACQAQAAAGEVHQDCPLRPVLCPHAACKERLSAKALEAHDAICAHKRVPCAKCGEEVPRGELRVHAAAACPEREASCTFSAVGCQSPLIHRDLAGHLEECCQAHLMLLLRALMEQQDLVQALTRKVADLEATCATQSRTSELETQRANALEAKLVALDKKAAQDLKKASDSASEDARKKADTAAAEAKKRLDAAADNTKKEMTSVRAELASLKASVQELGALRGEVAALKASGAAAGR